MITSVDHLIQLGELAPHRSPIDWRRVEAALGAEIPQDFKELLDSGGGGRWCDYIRVFVPAPGHGRLHLDLERSAERFVQLTEDFEEEVAEPPTELDEDSWLLAWASTGTGVQLYWLVSPGALPKDYPTLLANKDGANWERFDMTASELLLAICRDEFRIENFTESWIDRTRPFTEFGAK